MKIKMSKETLRDAVKYHATEELGLHPVIESNEDLAEWAGYVMAKLTGYGDELKSAGFAVEFPTDPELVIVQGNQDVIEAVRFYLL